MVAPTTVSRAQLLDALAESWRLTPDAYAERVARYRWRRYDYLRHTGRRVALALARGRGRIVVSAPPRHGKSEFLSHWVPTWFLDHFPHKRVILTSYESKYAEEWGRTVRDEFEHNPATITRLRADSKAAGLWHTPHGGGMIATGVGGPITGRGGDLVLIDDPIKSWQDAYSPLVRERLRDWFKGTLYTRLEPGATIIVLMTRWHPDDLAGWLLEKHSDEWENLIFPALSFGDGDLLGRPAGVPLCPERYDVAALDAIREGVGGDVWDAEYQQKPREVGTGRIYKGYTSANLDKNIAPVADLPLHLAFDFNISPGMHCIIGQYHPKADRFTAIHEIHRPRLTVAGVLDRFADWVKANGGWRYPELHVFGDASGRAQWSGTGETDYQIIRSKLAGMKIRHRIRVPRANPPIRDRINAVNEALSDVNGQGHYAIHPQCERLIEDFKTLKSDESGLIDKREHRLSHSSDAEGYRIHYLRPMMKIDVAEGGRISVTVN